MKPHETHAYSLGWDAGNFCAAYVSEDHDTALASRDGRHAHLAPLDGAHFRDGFVAGFYSSCELHEIADPGHRDRVAQLRAESGE